MTIIATQDGWAVEQVAIQTCKHLDRIISQTADGTPYAVVVDSIGFIHRAGEPGLVELKGARETDVNGTGMVASIKAPIGTLVHRLIKDPEQP